MGAVGFLETGKCRQKCVNPAETCVYTLYGVLYAPVAMRSEGAGGGMRAWRGILIQEQNGRC